MNDNQWNEIEDFFLDVYDWWKVYRWWIIPIVVSLIMIALVLLQWDDTWDDPTALWGMVEAVATVVAATIVVYQLKQVWAEAQRSRDEAAAHEADKYKWLIELVTSKRFQNNLELLKDTWGKEQFDETGMIMRRLFAVVTALDRLVEKEYIDRSNIYLTMGLDLADICDYVDRILEGEKKTEAMKKLKATMHRLIDQRDGAYEILTDMRKMRDEEDKK